MKRATIIAVVVAMSALTAASADRGFHSLANEIGRTSRMNRVTIPFFGVARFLVRVAHPDGIRDVKIAVFEKQKRSREIDLTELIGQHVDPVRWSPMIRARSKGEDVHIFFEDRGDNVGLLVAVQEISEIVVVEVELDIERFARELNEGGDFVSFARMEH